MGISIVVPIYNNEKTLKKCIESILNQSYKYFQLILIDDGSTDLSKKICLDYIKNDKRCVYYYIEHLGVSMARNVGLEKVNNKYVTFIDADDFIDKNHLANFARFMGVYDIVMQGIRHINLVGKDVGFLLNEKINTNFFLNACNKEEIDKIIFKIPAFGWVTNKLYDVDIIKKNKILFPLNSMINEDRAFNFLYFLYVESFCFINKVTYNYVENSESITHSYIEPHKFFLAAKEYDTILNKTIYQKNLSKYIAIYTTRFYAHSVATCILSNYNKIALDKRIHLIKYFSKSFFLSTTFKKYRFYTILFLISYLFNTIKKKTIIFVKRIGKDI